MQMFQPRYCSGTDWGTTNLLEVEIGDMESADNTDVNFTILVQSNSVGGYQGRRRINGGEIK